MTLTLPDKMIMATHFELVQHECGFYASNCWCHCELILLHRQKPVIKTKNKTHFDSRRNQAIVTQIQQK